MDPPNRNPIAADTLRLEHLLSVLSDEELERFCFHHFRELHDQFARGHSRGEKILRLIAHCDRRGRLGELERLATVAIAAPAAEEPGAAAADEHAYLQRCLAEEQARLHVLLDVAEVVGMRKLPFRMRVAINLAHERIHDLRVRVRLHRNHPDYDY
jgi:hypothetical protein